jgi:hypothetical protein
LVEELTSDRYGTIEFVVGIGLLLVALTLIGFAANYFVLSNYSSLTGSVLLAGLLFVGGSLLTFSSWKETETDLDFEPDIEEEDSAEATPETGIL